MLEMQLRGVPNKYRSAMAWEVQQNQSDASASGAPTLIQSSGDSFKASIDTDVPGSFNVITYFDADGDGSFSALEKSSLSQIAIVKVSVESSQIVTDPQFFVLSPSLTALVTRCLR